MNYPLDCKVLNFYRGQFSAVFIHLLPFEKQPAAIPVRWSEAMQLMKLPSLAAVDIGLRTMIGGLNKKYANEAYAQAILDLQSNNAIAPPPDCGFSGLDYSVVLDAIADLGYNHLHNGLAIDSTHPVKSLDYLKAAGPSGDLIYTPDKQILWAKHWDSHFAFLCGSEAVVSAIKTNADLEGFFCNEDTEVYWSIYN